VMAKNTTIKKMSIDQVIRWFESVKMPTFANIGRDKNIDGELLFHCIFKDFVQLGVSDTNDRKKQFDTQLKNLKTHGFNVDDIEKKHSEMKFNLQSRQMDLWGNPWGVQINWTDHWSRWTINQLTYDLLGQQLGMKIGDRIICVDGIEITDGNVIGISNKLQRRNPFPSPCTITCKRELPRKSTPTRYAAIELCSKGFQIFGMTMDCIRTWRTTTRYSSWIIFQSRDGGKTWSVHTAHGFKVNKIMRKHVNLLSRLRPMEKEMLDLEPKKQSSSTSTSICWWFEMFPSCVAGIIIEYCLEVPKVYRVDKSFIRSHMKITVPEIVCLQFCLFKNSTILHLILPGNKIGDAGAIYLSHGWKNNSVLEELDLSDNEIGDLGARAIGGGLRTSSSLKILNLSENNISLKRLNLSENNISESEVKDISAGLKANSTLTHLMFPKNNINDAELATFAEQLTNDSSLRVLDLKGNSFGDSSARVLIKCLKKNSYLDKLTLNGTIAISELRRKTLSLSLHSQEYQDIDVKIICSLLDDNDVLQTLDLSSNNIGDNGAQALANILRQHIPLVDLELSHNIIGDIGVSEIGQALELNSTLTKLHLDHNAIRDDGAQALAKCMKENTTLISLHLNNNHISPEGKAKLNIIAMEHFAGVVWCG